MQLSWLHLIVTKSVNYQLSQQNQSSHCFRPRIVLCTCCSLHFGLFECIIQINKTDTGAVGGLLLSFRRARLAVSPCLQLLCWQESNWNFPTIWNHTFNLNIRHVMTHIWIIWSCEWKNTTNVLICLLVLFLHISTPCQIPCAYIYIYIYIYIFLNLPLHPNSLLYPSFHRHKPSVSLQGSWHFYLAIAAWLHQCEYQL